MSPQTIMRDAAFAHAVETITRLNDPHFREALMRGIRPMKEMPNGERALTRVKLNVVLAEYHCRYDWRDRQVKDIREGLLYQTPFASPQGSLIPLTPREYMVIHRVRRPRRRGPRPSPAPQLLLFELVSTG